MKDNRRRMASSPSKAHVQRLIRDMEREAVQCGIAPATLLAELDNFVRGIAAPREMLYDSVHRRYAAEAAKTWLHERIKALKGESNGTGKD